MARYWRLVNFLTDSSALELSEAKMYDNGTPVDAIITSTLPPTSGTVDSLDDGSASGFVRWDDCTAPGFAIKYDFGATYAAVVPPAEIPQLRLGSGPGVGTFPVDVSIQWSHDGLYWTRVAGYRQVSYPGPSTLFNEPTAADGDKDFDKVVLLLNGDDLVDKSLAKNTLNKYGTADVSTVQKKFGTGSLLFNNGSVNQVNYFSITANIDGFNFPGDYTIECWLYAQGFGATWGSYIFGCGNTSNGGGGWLLEYGYSAYGNKIYYYCIDGSITSASPPPLNQWVHIAVCRKGNTTRLFVNGVAETQVLMGVTSIPALTFNMGRAANNAGTSGINGYVDEVRITKGLARYDGDFLPPARAFFSVVLLLPGDSLSDDRSVSNQQIALVGAPTISTGVKKFTAGSIQTSGSAALSLTNVSQGINFGAADFTVEFWFYSLSQPNDSEIFTLGSVSRPALMIRNDMLTYGYYNHGITGVTMNAWHHAAMTRSSGVIRWFLDGVIQGTVNDASSFPMVATELRIGGGNQRWSGYLSDIRVTEGAARYTINFDPPDAALPVPGSSETDPYSSNVNLLLYFDGFDGVTDFPDASVLKHQITAVNGAKISTEKSKWGGSSLKLTGTQDGLSLPGAQFGFGTSDFTIEAWVYLDGTPTGQYLAVVDIRGTPQGANAVMMMLDGLRKLGYYGQSEVRTTATVPIDQWCHVAMSRAGTTMRLFIDGVMDTSFEDTNSINAPALVYVGRVYDAAHPAIHGYIDDLRITKGVARYTASFTPPGPFNPADQGADPYKANVKLFIYGDAIEDVSDFDRTLTNVGSVQVSSAVQRLGKDTLRFNFDLNNYLNVTPVDDITLGTGDFTVEGFFNADDTVQAGYPWIIGAYGTSGLAAHIGVTSTNLNLQITKFEPYAALVCGVSLPKAQGAGSWKHMAWVRKNGVIKIFLNGVSVASAAYADDLPTAPRMRVGSMNTYQGGPDDFSIAYGYTGYMDEFRFTQGVARYDADFTPPESIKPKLPAFIFPLDKPSHRWHVALGKFDQINPLDIEPGTVFSEHLFAVVFTDLLDGGKGTITGTVKEKSNPTNKALRRKVLLINETAQQIVAQTWSDPLTGEFSFVGYRTDVNYTVISYDYTKTYRAVIADGLKAEITP